MAKSKMELKRIAGDAIPRALELAERYRLLNEPEQAESICKDVLEANPNDQAAIRTLLLAITDQFGRKQSATVANARDLANHLESEYERHYYTGVAMERWGRHKLQETHHGQSTVASWLEHAMVEFEQAEKLRPQHDDSALLRWNSCMRLLGRLPKPIEVHHGPDYGD